MRESDLMLSKLRRAFDAFDFELVERAFESAWVEDSARLRSAGSHRGVTGWSSSTAHHVSRRFGVLSGLRGCVEGFTAPPLPERCLSRTSSPQSVNAPGPSARSSEIEEQEAEEDRRIAAVDDRIKLFLGVHQPIGERHLARQDECHAPREDAGDREAPRQRIRARRRSMGATGIPCPNGPKTESRAASTFHARRRGERRQCEERSANAAPKLIQARRWSCRSPFLGGASEPSAMHPLKRGINAANQLLGAKLLRDRARLLEE